MIFPEICSQEPNLNLSLRGRLLALTVGFWFCTLSSVWARPPKVTVEKEEGDATITLTLEDEFIKDDAIVPCQLNVEILGANKPFTEGDTIKIRVIEDDVPLVGIGDDTLWELEEAHRAWDERAVVGHDRPCTPRRWPRRTSWWCSATTSGSCWRRRRSRATRR